MKKLLLIFLIIIPFRLIADIGVTTSVGIHIPTIMIPSLQLSYKNDDYLFGIIYGESTFDYESNDFKLPNATFINKGILARYFISDSFNIVSFVNQRLVSFSAESNQIVTKTEMEFISSSVGFGNYWTMRYGVTFGIDYFLMSKVFYKNVNIETNSDSDYIINEEEKGYNDISDTFEDIINFNGYFIVNIGFTF